jgi:hypothetical protein
MNGLAPYPETARRVAEIRRLVELGQYRIDPHAVAEAMIRWAERDIDTVAGREFGARPQNECSYPASSPAASLKVTPAGPSTTAPIHVRAALALGQAA